MTKVLDLMECTPEHMKTYSKVRMSWEFHIVSPHINIKRVGRSLARNARSNVNDRKDLEFQNPNEFHVAAVEDRRRWPQINSLFHDFLNRSS